MVALTLPPCKVMAGSKNEIRFAFQDRIGSVLPILAVHEGYFADQGLKVKSLRFNSGPACAEALYSGAADIGAMGDTTAIIMLARDSRLCIFACHASGEDRHRLMVLQDAPIVSLHDLAGKRLAVKKGTSTYGGLLAALDREHIDPTTIGIIDLTPPTMITALQSGAVDAFAASEPTPSTAEEKGARQLLTFGGLGNVYPILMLARRGFLEEHASSMDRFVNALTRAQEYAVANPEVVIRLMSAETGLSPSTTRAAMQRHQYHLGLDGKIVTSLEKTAQFLRDQKIIDVKPDVAASLNRRLFETLNTPL